MEATFISQLFITVLFIIGYSAIVLEERLRINKSAIALVTAVLCWTAHVMGAGIYVEEAHASLGHHLSEVCEIVFFLFGAMAIVETVDAHNGFSIVTKCIKTRSRTKLLWVVGFITFFMSAVLDNLTSTIVMISMLKGLIPARKDRLIIASAVVIAANAGGAWTPIGDVTTTMLWMNGQLSVFPVMKSLFLPSVVSIVVTLFCLSFQMIPGNLDPVESQKGSQDPLPGGRLLFFVGTGLLAFVPAFKALTGLPPYMGILIGLGFLWVLTDILHGDDEAKAQLKVSHVLSKIDFSSILFFLGILLTIGSMQSAGMLKYVASWLDSSVGSCEVIATVIGLASAVVDNVPLVAACMGMYDLQAIPMDARFWQMLAYCAGTGGSILIIGSAAGVALMGMEKIDFFWYMKKVSLSALIGYLSGIAVYLFLN
ncbi:MAG: NhaD family Na+/H+ antiporter [Chlamydiales bacterium]|jgi:NhaD family Na+/H+ antiporter